MSKNIIIQEGGVGRQFTADKLKTALVGGGSCLWIPEDTVPLGTKNITEDGTYEAAADGLYGYSSVTVRGIGKVTGRDPDTGEEMEISTQTDPQTGEDVIQKKTLPSSIRITTQPTRLTYVEGDLIDYAGMIVKAFLKSGAVFTDETYPDGVIPDGELDKPEQVAHGGGVGQGYCPNVSAAGTVLGTIWDNNGRNPRTFTKANDEPAECVMLRDSPWWNGPMLISTTYSGATYKLGDLSLSPGATVGIDGVQYFINYSHWYSANRYETTFPVFEVWESSNRTEPAKWTQQLFQQGAGDIHMTVPVNWLCPYGKGETFTDSFIITVNPATGAE